jgi:hypothetical protein
MSLKLEDAALRMDIPDDPPLTVVVLELPARPIMLKEISLDEWHKTIRDTTRSQSGDNTVRSFRVDTDRQERITKITLLMASAQEGLERLDEVIGGPYSVPADNDRDAIG